MDKRAVIVLSRSYMWFPNTFELVSDELMYFSKMKLTTNSYCGANLCSQTEDQVATIIIKFWFFFVFFVIFFSIFFSIK